MCNLRYICMYLSQKYVLGPNTHDPIVIKKILIAVMSKKNMGVGKPKNQGVDLSNI